MMKLEINELDLLQLLLQCKFEGVEQALDMMKALADEEDRESVLDYHDSRKTPAFRHGDIRLQ